MHDLRIVLQKVFTDVLERMAFMFAEEPDEYDLQELKVSDGLTAEISFSGTREGRLRTAAPMEFCRLLAGAMLGLDPEQPLPEGAQEDALRELTNVACGEFMEAIATGPSNFRMGVPDTRPCPAAEMRAMTRDSQMITLVIDDLYLVTMAALSDHPQQDA